MNQTATPSPPLAAPASGRLDAIDLVRGIVMVLMALDHARGYFSYPGLDPVDLNKTTAALFLTRWVTHFCAPVFMFLAGTSAFLYGQKVRSRGRLAWFLLSRGIWLVILEFTLIRFVWFFDLQYEWLAAIVIWAIGCSMIVLSGLVFLPTAAVAAIGLLLIGFHNLFDGFKADFDHPLGQLWAVLHSGEGFEIWGLHRPLEQLQALFSGGSLTYAGVKFYPGYPLLPWIGVMAAGYALGAMYLLDRPIRRKQLIGLGLTLTLAFVFLRYANLYGDRRPWTGQSDPIFTVFSFLNCHKYPPSLLFLLMTLGPAITLLGILDRPAGPIGRFFITYGRVPLFYYILHILVLHLMAALVAYLRYGMEHLRTLTEPPKDWGFDLWAVYLAWLGTLLVLYWPCRGWAALKRRHPGGILSYL